MFDTNIFFDMSFIKNIFKTVPFLVFASGFSQNVNEFTGSLNYNVPLMHLPSNKGEGINISASYNAGIGVKQPASEIGLGWQLNAGGAIYRSVSGLPDDGRNCSVFDQKTKSFNIQHGLLYSAGDADIYRSSTNMDSLNFMFPDYDDYMVSGPGIGGKMTPFIFDYEMYLKDNSSESNEKRYYKYPGTYGGKTRSPQFHFNGDFADTLISRHYSVTPISGSTPIKYPGDNISGLYYNNDEPYLGKSVSGSSITAQNFNPTTMRLGSANYVEYFRNGQIDSIQSASQNISGFINYQTNCLRDSSYFPNKGIGAFRITTSAGYVYHYSLPVYIIKTENHNYPLENNYNVPSFDLSAYSNNPNDQYYTWTSNTDVVIKHKINNKYAYKWLLTAITGPDYEDTNGNHIVDNSDKGYWVFFDYKKWSDNFPTRTPHYGFDYYYGRDEATEILPASQGLTGTNYKLTGKAGVVNLTYKELYHLSKIQTTSHTAIFVRETRNDEVSSHTSTSITSSISPTPDLSVKRIILFKNDVYAPSPSATISFGWGLSTSNTYNGVHYFFGENWYSSNFNSFKNYILKQVEFSQDYSLSRNYQGNVHVRSLNTSVTSSPSVVQSNLTVQTYSLSGKLTLNKITTYDYQSEKVLPSIVFDYNYSNSTDNPDYDPRKTDYWGYYKSDITSNGYSGYTSYVSKDYTDAWSLRKITEPLGGVSEFEYESNSYTKVLDYNNPSGYRKPTFIFPITTINNLASPNQNYIKLTLEEYPNTPNEFSSLTSGTISGLVTTASIPLYKLPIPTNPNSLNQFTHWFYGNATYLGTASQLTLTSLDSSAIQNNNLLDCHFLNRVGTYAPGSGDYTYAYGETAPNYMTYSGYGYVSFLTPSTHNVYGGGIRVRKIMTKNNTNEVYTTDYIYENGVATMEADRFSFPVSKGECGAWGYIPSRLSPFIIDKHSLGVGIGYGKVTVKNLGRSNTANGSIVTEFINQNPITGTTKISDFKVTQVHSSNPPTASTSLFECIDKFSPYWGLVKETKVLDINNNIVSRTINEYENTEQGAIVENFAFRDEISTDYFGTRDYICIMRHYPVVLKKSKSYGMGSFAESEVLKRDEITGETTLMRSVGQNASTSLTSKVPAFRIGTYSAMGPKSINSSNKNLLSFDAYNFSTIDTTLTSSSDFYGIGITTFTNQSNVRTFNGSNPFTVQTNTLSYWKPYKTYAWSGTVGSLDQYGLYKRSELSSNPFNFSNLAANSAHWRMNTEITMSDDLGHVLESRDVSNRFNARKFGYNHFYLLASCENSNYNSFTYSGFELGMPNTSSLYIDGEIYLATGTGSLSLTMAHTGYKSLHLGSGNSSNYKAQFTNNGTYDTGVERGRMYRAIVWVNASAPSDAYLKAEVTGVLNDMGYSQSYTMYTNDANVITVGSWKRLVVEFKVPDYIDGNNAAYNLVVSMNGGTGGAYFDDLLFYPVESSIKGNVYNPDNGRVIAEINQLGYATFYTYDAAGRILEVSQEIPGSGIKLIKRNTYNFANTN